jgi:hypothetical protein
VHPNINDTSEFSYTFVSENDEPYLAIKQLTSTREIVSYNDQGLQAFDCFQDGINSTFCHDEFARRKIKQLWTLVPTNLKG